MKNKTITLALPIKIKRTLAEDGYVITDANQIKHYFYNKLEYDGNEIPVGEIEKQTHKFNVGDMIQSISNGRIICIASIDKTGYHCFYNDSNEYHFFGFTAECDYELCNTSLLIQLSGKNIDKQ